MDLRTSGLPAYAASKLYLLMASRDLNRRLRGTGVDVFPVHPGEEGGREVTLNQSRKETVARQGELQLHKRVVVHHGRREGEREGGVGWGVVNSNQEGQTSCADEGQR